MPRGWEPFFGGKLCGGQRYFKPGGRPETRIGERPV
jgi:hypothetical protein